VRLPYVRAWYLARHCTFAGAASGRTAFLPIDTATGGDATPRQNPSVVTAGHGHDRTESLMEPNQHTTIRAQGGKM
jgi:hypothetical protein